MEKPSVIGVVFSPDRQKVLLVQRRDVPVWVLPGGGVEANESEEKALVRELFEETGFFVKIKRKVGEYFPINKLARWTFLYEAEILEGEARISDETKSVEFFPLEAMKKLLIPPPYPEWIEDAHKNLDTVIKKKLTKVTYLCLLKNFFLHPCLVFRFFLSKIGLTINS
jgi:8-oxo-dGTP pyrophosphatase MutT (NUDIX family)